MNPHSTVLFLIALFTCHAAGAVELVLTSPRDFQVVQRSTPTKGALRIAGQLSADAPGDALVEARFVGTQPEAEWQRLNAKVSGRSISALLEAPAGGWWKLAVRISHAGKVLASGGVEHIGVGEVFVIAGRSNSANFGEEKQTTQTGRVAAFDGTNWQLAHDPQPGAGGKGGSFMPPLGDTLAKKFDVPIGFVACGIGASSVRGWLPKDAIFLTGQVEQLRGGARASNGAAFDMFVARMSSLGPNGFRAVLWHQGESDANQKDPTRTLPGKLYREYLETLIRESRRAIGWDAPWFVAQASYHVPGDERSDDIRAAQASLWKDGLAHEGPDSDALKGDLRERNGQGVHFSGKGLREHGAKWAEKIIPWLDRQWTAPRAIALAAAAVPAAELRLAAMFSDHMVLQREQRVPVWGWGDVGATVTVRFAGQTKTAVADKLGRWTMWLDAMNASAEPRTMTVSAGEARVEIRDVLVGEVWLCAGQSNMAMTVDGKTGWLYVGGVAQAKEVVRDSANPLLRQFHVEWKTDTKPQETCTGKWTVAGPDTTADFSATGYFFARELQERLRIPVGILSASFGGASAEGWTSREALANESDAEFVAKLNQLTDDYDNHEQLVAKYAAALAKWEKEQVRADPNGGSDDGEWAAPAVSTADWKTVTLPASLAKLGYTNGGVVWLRREIEVPAEFGTSWRLDFPACRAFTAVYLNGTKIFEATPANGLESRASRPSFGKGVAKVGRNTLTIKLHGYSGASGITGGAFSIVPFAAKLQAVPLNGEWLCKEEKAFPPLRTDAESRPVAPVKGTLHWMPVPSQFNAMLHPLIPFAMRGAAWYQGESNVGNPRYAKHLEILINDWRRRWGIGDFPFYLCQLHGFGERKTQPADSTWAECREMQTAALKLPNTGMANLIDTCEDGDLHPLNKQDAGHRLALVALANTYGFKDLAWSGPVFDSMRLADGKAFITFKHAEGGLVAKPLPATYRPNLRKPDLPPKPLELPSPGSELQGFAICENRAQPDGSTLPHWVNAHAKIEGTSIVVWSEEVKHPVAVRYAWADHPVCNLQNKAGLPAFPFRTDSLPRLSDKTK